MVKPWDFYDKVQTEEYGVGPWADLHYKHWNAARAAYFKSLGDWWRGKDVLVVAAGGGNIAALLAHELGANVICSDVWECTLDRIRKVWDLPTRIDDLEAEPSTLPKTEVLVHLGALYHLSDPVKGIRDALACAPTVFLESSVAPTLEAERFFSRPENHSAVDQAHGGVGCRMAPSWVEAQFAAYGVRYALVHRHPGGRESINGREHQALWYLWKVER